MLETPQDEEGSGVPGGNGHSRKGTVINHPLTPATKMAATGVPREESLFPQDASPLALPQPQNLTSLIWG